MVGLGNRITEFAPEFCGLKGLAEESRNAYTFVGGFIAALPIGTDVSDTVRTFGRSTGLDE